MVFFGPISSVYDFLTFGVMLGALDAHAPLFRSGWFVESLATQARVVFVIRTRRVPFFHSRPSRPLLATTLAVVLAGLVLPYSPVAHTLGFRTPPTSRSPSSATPTSTATLAGRALAREQRKELSMRLELGSPVRCSDGPFGELADVVIDPTRKRVTHLVVQPHHEHRLARLVPVELAKGGGGEQQEITLRATIDDVRRRAPVQEFAFLRLDEFPVEDPDWDVGLEEVLALPYYDAVGLGPMPVD